MAAKENKGPLMQAWDQGLNSTFLTAGNPLV